MSITATPTLKVAGAAVAGSLASAPPLVAVDELRITWGRGSVLESPQPATATLAVLDRAPGAPFARRADLIGQPIVLGWTGGGGGAPTFAGQITDVSVTPLPGALAGAGFRVALAASSFEVDLANVVQPENTRWPAETFDARRVRVLGLIPAALLSGGGGLGLPDVLGLNLQYYAPPGGALADLQAAPLDVSGRSALDLLHQLYRSWSPLPAVYDPSGRFTYAGRRRYGYSAGRGLTMSGQLVPSPDAGGRYVAASIDAGGAGLYLDGGMTEYAGSLTQQLDSRITRVEVAWSDGTTTSTVSAPTVNTGSEATIGRRVLSVDSMHGTAAGAQQLANLYGDLASTEARAAVFLGRSWLPQLGCSPLVGILGGTISYRAGEWSVQATPAPTRIDPTPYSWAPLTIAAAAAPGVRLADLDRSVTFGDFGFLDVGAGRTLLTAVPYKGNPL